MIANVMTRRWRSFSLATEKIISASFAFAIFLSPKRRRKKSFWGVAADDETAVTKTHTTKTDGQGEVDHAIERTANRRTATNNTHQIEIEIVSVGGRRGRARGAAASVARGRGGGRGSLDACRVVSNPR